MRQSLVRAKVESMIAMVARLPPRPIIAGALSGVVSGLVLGAFTGPIGAVLGMWMGVGAGLVTGYVLARDDQKETVRTRELDAIIGITKGSMGAGTIVIQDTQGEDEDPPPYSSKEAWLSEWLTPPPPSVAR
jgi:hypothetical protein